MDFPYHHFLCPHLAIISASNHVSSLVTASLYLCFMVQQIKLSGETEAACNLLSEKSLKSFREKRVSCLSSYQEISPCLSTTTSRCQSSSSSTELPTAQKWNTSLLIKSSRVAITGMLSFLPLPEKTRLYNTFFFFFHLKII